MSNELISLEELQKELAVVADEESSKEKVGGAKYLSVRGGKFAIGDERLGEELTVVVVATAFENAYYESKYDPDKPNPPVCFSISEKDDGMVPHDTSPKPQANACATCPMNQWESGNGKGKACKNGRRLVLLAYGNDGLAADQSVMLRLPPTSLRNWAAYAKAVTARTKLPTFAVITKLGFDQKATWPVVTFDFIDTIKSTEELLTIRNQRDDLLKLALEPYDVSGYDGEKEPVPQISASKKSKMS